MAKSNPAPAPLPFKFQADKVFAVLDNPEYSAEGFTKKVIEQIRALEYPSAGKQAAAENELGYFEATARTARMQDQPGDLRRAAQALLQACQTLAQRPPTPTIDDIVTQLHPGLQDNCGYASLTIDLLRRELTPADLPIRKYDESSITTAARVINRRELIDKYAPRAMAPEFRRAYLMSHERPAAFIQRNPSLAKQLKQSGFAR